MGTRSNTSAQNVDLIGRRAEAMASQIADQMAVAHEVQDQGQLDWLHALIQHLVVIRQAVLAMREHPTDVVRSGPRTFTVPDRPDDVTSVTDAEGLAWKLVSRRRNRWHHDGEMIDWTDLVYHYGPLTEAPNA